MAKRQFIVPVTLDSVARKKDHGVSIRLTSNEEIDNKDFSYWDTFVGHAGHFIFFENELVAEDIPLEDAPTREGKSKGQRMRAVWFLVWKKRNVEEPFDTWYDKRFESLMDKWKEELD